MGGGFVVTTRHFDKDRNKHKFTKEDVDKCLISGIHFKKEDLFQKHPEQKSEHYAAYMMVFKSILIGYCLRTDHITLIHADNVRNWVEIQFKKRKKLLEQLKKPIPKH